MISPGRPGVLVRTYLLSYVDNALRSKQMTAGEVTAEPVDQVVAVGTKERPPARTSSETGTSADGKDWAALARCESGGNPRAVSSTGKYRGLYQFSVGNVAQRRWLGRPDRRLAGRADLPRPSALQRSGRGQWPVCGKYL